MKRIERDSIEFQNFKDSVNKNKLKNNNTNIDRMISLLKTNNIILGTLRAGTTLAQH